MIPVGVVYDPFLERAMEPWSFGIHAGGQSILVDTPSGVTLASEGGAHQSIKTPSIGLEQPECVTYEPAFVLDTEWTLLSAMVTEALEAADRLGELGFAANVVVVTSPGLLFDAAQARRGFSSEADWILDVVLPADRAEPMVTVVDGHPHTLAFLAGINRVPSAHLGVTKFGQSGDLESVYRYHHIDTDSIIGAALDLVD